jgi:hypothetical protein
MTSCILLASTAMLGSLSAGLSFASPCGDRIAALERHIEEGAASAVAGSSGGQAVAAAREARASEPATPNEPPGTFQNPRQEAQATHQAAEAGGGGIGMTEARATLNQARTLDERGDASACLEAVAEAERQAAPRR